MDSSAIWDMTPRRSVEQECARRGEADVVAACVVLLADDDVDHPFIFAIGGPAAESVLGPHPRQDQRYFLQVRAAAARATAILTVVRGKGAVGGLNG